MIVFYGNVDTWLSYTPPILSFFFLPNPILELKYEYLYLKMHGTFIDEKKDGSELKEVIAKH